MFLAEVKINDHGNFRFLTKLPKKAEDTGNFELWNLAQKSARITRQSALDAGINEWDSKIIAPIRAHKISKGVYGISNSRIGKMLDEMPDHYVSLKRGRLITKWARERFGTRTITGKSRVKRGIRGGISGALFVTQHPYVEKAYLKILVETDNTVIKIANKIAGG